MKKFTALLLCLILSLAGCGTKPVEKAPPVAEAANMPDVSEAADTEEAQKAVTEESAAFQEAEVLKEPPALTVVCGENNSIEALKGTSSWIYQNEDGTSTGITADSMHPLNAKKFMPCLALYAFDAKPFTAQLQWSTAPDTVSARCWNEADWGQPDAESEGLQVLTLMLDSNVETEPILSVELKDGNYIYEVIAEWNSSEKYSGKVCYSFCIMK